MFHCQPLYYYYFIFFIVRVRPFQFNYSHFFFRFSCECILDGCTLQFFFLYLNPSRITTTTTKKTIPDFGILTYSKSNCIQQNFIRLFELHSPIVHHTQIDLCKFFYLKNFKIRKKKKIGLETFRFPFSLSCYAHFQFAVKHFGI